MPGMIDLMIGWWPSSLGSKSGRLLDLKGSLNPASRSVLVFIAVVVIEVVVSSA